MRTISGMGALKRFAEHPRLGTSKPRVVQQHVDDRVRLSAAAGGQRLDGFSLARRLGKPDLRREKYVAHFLNVRCQKLGRKLLKTKVLLCCFISFWVMASNYFIWTCRVVSCN